MAAGRDAGDPNGPEADLAASVDGLPEDDASGRDAAPRVCVAPTGLGRAVAWARTNRPFVSALTMAMGVPPAQFVTDYYTLFHATATHLWANGLPSEVAGFSAAKQPGFRYVSWVGPDGKSCANAHLLGGVAPLAGRIGYQVHDEPLDLPSLQAMQAGAKAVRAADPDALVIFNFAPNAALAPLATEAAKDANVDVLAYDQYSDKKVV